jgi:integrase
MIAGKRHDMGLGTADGPDPVKLAQARNAAIDAHRLIRSGIDPLSQKKGAPVPVTIARTMTFEQAARAYIAEFRPGWTTIHLKQSVASLETYVFPIIGRFPVENIDLAAVLRVLTPIWQSKTETAKRVRARVESVLGYATTKGLRTGDNPARWQKHLENVLPRPGKIAKVEHYAALPYAELPSFMTRLREQESVAARALEFCILTVSRTSEVIEARWSEIDGAARLWLIPGSRTKNGRDKRVPLSARPLTILAEMRAIRQGEHVFTRGNDAPLAQHALLRTLATIHSGITVHGFRSTCSDWITEKTDASSDLREMMLGHDVGDTTVRAYMRSDMFARRLVLSEDWAKQCDGSFVCTLKGC